MKSELPEIEFRMRKRTLSSLSDEERDLLEQMRREPMDFVDHPDFRRGAKAETEIMAPVVSKGDRPIQRFIQAVADPIGGPEKVRTPRGALLSADQERRLFVQYNYCRRRWVGLIQRAGTGQVGVRKLREIMRWFRSLLACRDQIVNANMPLVLAMAKRTRLTNVDFPELISEGNMALLRAVAKFDVSRGFKFSTYACRAILKAFSRASMRQSRFRERFPAEFDPEMEKSDFLENRREEIEADCAGQLKEILGRNAAELSRVEQVVIRERFALDRSEDAGGSPKTLDEVGQLIGVTKERVRQIQNRALVKIREALDEELLVA